MFRVFRFRNPASCGLKKNARVASVDVRKFRSLEREVCAVRRDVSAVSAVSKPFRLLGGWFGLLDCSAVGRFGVL